MPCTLGLCGQHITPQTFEVKHLPSQFIRVVLNFMVPGIIIIIIIIYPLTARVVWTPQMILQPVFSIFPCSPLPSGTWPTPGLSIPWCCLPISSSDCLVFSPLFTVPCKMVLARPDEWDTWPCHCSLRLFTMVRSSCGPIACWILARTSSFVTWSLY